MNEARPITTSLAAHLKLSKPQSPRAVEGKMFMEKILGSITYAMICTRPDLSYSLSSISRYMIQERLIGMHPNGS